MKKVLFATTALVATAGVAAADVTFGGYGRFGILYQEATDDVDITSRFRLQIDASAESDQGVTFGARTRLEGEERDDAVGQRPQFSGVRFFARSGGLEIGVGNIFGGLGAMPGQYPIDLGLTGLSYAYTAIGVGGFDEFSSGGSGRSGSNGVEAMYSIGDFGAHISASDVNDRIAGHIRYTFAGFTVAAGYQDSDSDFDTEFSVSGSYDFGPGFVNVAYAEDGFSNYRATLVGGYDVGASTQIVAYYTDDEVLDDSYGIGFEHDLGGGVTLEGGYDNNFGNDIADLGVRFNF